MLSLGLVRHLSQCSDAHGLFTILAIDHRGVLVTEMEKQRGHSVNHAEVVAFKNAVARYVLPACSGILTDPDYGMAGIVDGSIPGGVGLLAPLEVTNYDVHPSQRSTAFIEGWGVAKIKKMGGSGVKLLLYYHPGAANAQQQTDLVDRIVAECQAQHIPFFLEPIAYSLDPQQPMSNLERRQVVVEAARHFSGRGITILKTEFPLEVAQEPDESSWAEALAELDAVCAVPWALLSAGTTFEVFLRQTVAACQAGASGVIVGRAVWSEALGLEGQALHDFLVTVGKPRMALLAEACRLYGRPWGAKYTLPTLDEGWYQEF